MKNYFKYDPITFDFVGIELSDVQPNNSTDISAFGFEHNPKFKVNINEWYDPLAVDAQANFNASVLKQLAQFQLKVGKL